MRKRTNFTLSPEATTVLAGVQDGARSRYVSAAIVLRLDAWREAAAALAGLGMSPSTMLGMSFAVESCQADPTARVCLATLAREREHNPGGFFRELSAFCLALPAAVQ